MADLNCNAAARGPLPSLGIAAVLLSLCGAGSQALSAPQGAAGAALPAELSAAGWILLAVPGKPLARFAAAPGGGIEVIAEESVGFLYRALSEDGAAGSRLAWRWRVDASGRPTDLSRPGGDDRPLALHVWFPEDRSRTSFWQGLKRDLRRLAGFPVPGKVLTYVWGGTRPRGSKVANPHFEGDGVLVVLRPGRSETGRWVGESIDFAADFEMAFGYRPSAPSHIAVSADCDDTRCRARAVIADIRFEG